MPGHPVLTVLNEVDDALSHLLVTGARNAHPLLDEIETLAENLAAFRLERLAQALRTIPKAESPSHWTASIVTARTLTRRVRQRLLGPQEVPPEAIAFPEQEPERPQELGEMLRDSDPMLRAWAARRLAERGPTAIPVLMQAYRSCGTCIRRRVAWALGQMDGEAPLRHLVRAMRDPDVERAVEAALLNKGDQARPLLRERLEDRREKSKHARRLAAKLLWRLRDGSAFIPIQSGGLPEGVSRRLPQSLGDDEDRVVAVFARLTLGGEAPADDWGPEVQTIWQMARVEAGEEPVESLYACWQSLKAEALPLCARWLRNGPLERIVRWHYAVRWRWGRGNEQYRAGHVVTALADVELLPLILDDESPALLPYIYDVLVEIGEESVPLLLEWLRKRWDLRTVVESLGQIGDPRAIAPLTEALGEVSRWDRNVVKGALQAIGAPAVLPLDHQPLEES